VICYSNPGKGKTLFSTSRYLDQFWNSSILLFNRQPLSFEGVERQEREAHHRIPYIAQVKNEWIYGPTALISLCVVDWSIFIFISPFLE
jgi:hypothetical protein